MENDAFGYGLQRCVSRFGVPVFGIGLFVVDGCSLSLQVVPQKEFLKIIASTSSHMSCGKNEVVNFGLIWASHEVERSSFFIVSNYYGNLLSDILLQQSPKDV